MWDNVCLQGFRWEKFNEKDRLEIPEIDRRVILKKDMQEI
jgi:hypothetical protein